MKDGIIKENGTSRLVKGSLPATYDEFKALAASAGVPVDVFFNAAGWQQLPTSLNKANLLQDFTATLLGLDPADDPTVDDAFLNVFLTSSNAGLLKIRVYETGTKTPISGVRIVGVNGLLGEDLYADKNGVAIGLATSETTTCRVGTDYIDLTGQTTFSGSTPAQKITNVTLYATRVSNPSGKIETYTTSTQRMFTDKVKRVDVHAVGAGAGGSTGAAGSWSDGNASSVEGGNGGGAGSSVYRLSVSFTANQLFSIVVGNKGAGGVFSSGGGDYSKVYGTNGGASSALGVSAPGGSRTAGGKGAYIEYSGTATITNATSGASSTTRRFGDSSQPVAGGGDGGGGAAYMSSGGRYAKSAVGADPNGGDGGETSGAYPQTANPGKAATGYGGGGGGAAANSSSQKSANGGDGYQGIVYVRWFY